MSAAAFLAGIALGSVAGALLAYHRGALAGIRAWEPRQAEHERATAKRLEDLTDNVRRRLDLEPGPGPRAPRQESNSDIDNLWQRRCP